MINSSTGAPYQGSHCLRRVTRVAPMPPRPSHRHLGAMATVAALTLVGCASSSAQTEASAFLAEHAAGAARLAAATKAVEAEVSQLSSSPAPSQLNRLVRMAAEGHRNAVQASEWNVAAEGGEEEDLPRAEAEVTEGANDLANAMSALQAYARAPRATRLANYDREVVPGRERWNEGISEIWYLARHSNPPTV